MITRDNLTRLGDYVWEIPRSFRHDMRVPCRIYAEDAMLPEIFKDKSLDQLVNLATLPGIEKYALVMPDAHEGYGSPIGGVFATREEDGVISPGAVGYDENCGVRLLLSARTAVDVSPRLDALATAIQRAVPSGLGKGHAHKISEKDIDRILEHGAGEMVRQGYGSENDLAHCEARGRLEWADASEVSDTAKKRGRDQVGTLGSGNHFLEVQKVDVIFDEGAATAFGLFKSQIVIMVHTGSRGLGHQIATDYIRLMLDVMPSYGITLPDNELACAPFASAEGQRFFRAMACGANFAWANRQMITHALRHAWSSIYGDDSLLLLYDVAHNIAKKETHYLEIMEGAGRDPARKNREPRTLIVHRKGATRAFPPGHPELPDAYRAIGQPVLIPGSMGTASYVLAGREEGAASFYSACHGAGRRMSRHQAIKTVSGRDMVGELREQGIVVKCYSLRGVAEEAPIAYKNIDEVVDVVHGAGLARKVARLVPIAVIKGE